MKKLFKNILIPVFTLFIFSLLILFFVLPKQEKSVNEKRVLAEKPDFTFSEIISGEFSEKLENYLSDHFPFRDLFVGINAYWDYLTFNNGSNGVYLCKDGYLIAEQIDIDLNKAKSNINVLNNFAKRYDMPASVIIVPTSGYILNGKLPKNHKEYLDDEVFSVIKNNCGNIRFIDVRDCFKKSDIQLYYKTDHHLTSQGAMILYNKVCDEFNLKKAEFNLAKTTENFYGTSYSKGGYWLSKPDNIEIYKSKNENIKVTITEKGKDTAYNSMYFLSHLNEQDKYPVFLDGNHSVVKIENGSCKNGKKLLMLRDSFAHCFSTFLIENYEEIYLVDMRYFRGSLKNIVEKEKLNEIMFLYSCENIASSTDIAWLSLS